MSGGAMSIGRYFTEMLDSSLDWNDVERMVKQWNGRFFLKGVMSVEDAKKAMGLDRYHLYPLAAAGQAGVTRALGQRRTEVERDMKLMGCSNVAQLSRSNLRFR